MCCCNMTGGANPTYNTVYDSGAATLTVNGHADTYSWGSGSTPSSIASGLASAINGDGSAAVSATASGAVVNLTARTTGTGTNYSLTSSTSYSTSNFTSSSFSLGNSGAALTGGTNATYVYDSGTVSITVNGTTSSASYGQNDTTSTVASSLAAAVNTNSPSVTASASGNVVTLTSKTEGAYTNYALTSSNASSNGFSPASFSSSGSGSTMTGGTGSTIYSLGLSYEPNGDVQSDSDNINGNWAYTYDDFDRLNTAVSNSGLGCAEVYDRYGNRYQQNTYSGSCLTPQYSIPSGNNRIPQFTYDLAGNVINDTSYTYAYDAEERISSVSTTGGTVIASYVYDADGRRVRKIAGSTVDYLYDLSGHEISEISSAGVWNRGEVYAGGQHVATYNGGATYFTHADWLGTERVRSTVGGGVYSTWTSYPFGEGSPTPNPGPTHFTGKERDAESGLDYFGARYYGSGMGRFMSPDPSGLLAQHPEDPQTGICMLTLD